MMLLLLVGSCMAVRGPQAEKAEFEVWLAAAPERAAAFARFEPMLQEAEVAGVVPTHQLWLVDRLHPECVAAPYVIPAEEAWPNVVPALRFIRPREARDRRGRRCVRLP